MKIHIISAGRNHQQWARRSVRSVLDQHVPEGVELAYTWIDDASAPAVDPGAQDEHMMIVRTPDRRGGLRNIYEAAMRSDADVCFAMGGDDQLLPGAVARLAELFMAQTCWVMYGSYVATDPAHVVRSRPVAGVVDVRNYPFVWMPLAWRAALTLHIRVEDLQIGGGYWQPSSGDVALTLPLLEMAGPLRVRYNKQPLVLYRVHDGNDATTDRVLQDFLWWYSRSRPRYSQLARLEDEPVIDVTDPRSPVRDAIQFAPWTERPEFGRFGRVRRVRVETDGQVVGC